MLSLFPSLLSYEPIAPFLLRVTLGAVLLVWSYKRIRNRQDAKTTMFGIVEGIAGILILIGLWMQLGALIAAVIFLIKLVHKLREKALFTSGVNYYFILFIISLSLLFLGPGDFSFDLPL